MTEQKPQSDNELRMFELCKQLKFQKAQLDGARKSNINSEIAIKNMNGLISSLEGSISALEKNGIKKVEIKDSEIETQVQQPTPTGVK